MCPSRQFERFHVLLTRKDAAELLLDRSSRGACLPVLTIPAETRTAEELTRSVRDSWGLTAYCLMTLPSEDSAGRTAILEVTCPSERIPGALQWSTVASLGPADFDDATSFATMEQSLRSLDRYRSGDRPGTFAKPGCLRAVTDWIEDQSAALGVHLTGVFRQLNASPTFSLIRFETNGPALWFKAVGQPNLQEYRVTLTLARLFPTYLPPIVAVRADWNAWLSIETEGTHLDRNSTLGPWTTVVKSLANLQIASLGHGLRILDAGAKDARLPALHAQVDPFVEEAGALLKRQKDPSSHQLSRNEILQLGQEITESLDVLEASNLRNVLGHLDFNSTNVLISDQRSFFLDWAEACVGPSILTLGCLLECFESFGNGADAQAQLVSLFVRSWSALESPAATVRAVEVAPLLGCFARLVNSAAWARKDQFLRPNLAAFLRHYVWRLKSVADRRPRRRNVCLT